ncbi:hypothetical protein T265_01311 [Opisthorchis viverrini]|uniref:Uncharacterized protein n=1 Tax=Opisthorchis viverrini TaxID=6198 RepID=A0A075A306_OPIVI|nr:hypothetical protein T265_01311 [Opisthorchis viverrini]KER32622.1 hypothetical protein T265_01311 [Opisthorchis viverrini]
MGPKKGGNGRGLSESFQQPCEWVLSLVTPFRCVAAMPPKVSTRAEVLPGCPYLYRESREATTDLLKKLLNSIP